jgi:hypothetical protein
MGTKIEITDETWNPTRGCSGLSPACDHCYSMRVGGGTCGVGSDGKPQGKVALIPDRLKDPLRWSDPRTTLVDSMSDPWHESMPLQEIIKVYAVMCAAPQHTCLVVTKRADRRRYVLSEKLATGKPFADKIWRRRRACSGGPESGSSRVHARRFDAVDASYSSGAYRVDERVRPGFVRRGSYALDHHTTSLQKAAHLLDDEVPATRSGRKPFRGEQRGVRGMDEDFTWHDLGACP